MTTRRRITVTLLDDTEQTVWLDARDQAGYDFARSRGNWPEAVKAPMLAMSWMCWNAARRAGLGVPDKFDPTEAPFLDFADETATEPVDPTGPGPGPGS